MLSHNEDSQMSMFDYKIIPAPRPTRISLSPGAAAEAAEAMEETINAEAREGWIFLRAESGRRNAGLLGRREEKLVFRRPRDSRAPATPVFRGPPGAEPTRGDFEADVRSMIREIAPLGTGTA